MSALKALFGFVVMMTCGLPVLAGDAAPTGAPKSTGTVAASMPMPVVQPKFEEYVSRVIIKGRWGSKPGEYRDNISEGNQTWPTNFIVTDNGHIYVLDDFNNRVQHYNAEGKLLEMIPIESYKLASKKEIAKNNGLDYSSVSIDWFFREGNAIYAVASKRTGGIGSARVSDMLKLVDGRFKKLTLSKEIKTVQNTISRAARREKIKHVFNGNTGFRIAKGKTEAEDQYIYNGSPVEFADEDKNGNRWVVGGRSLRKYSPKGHLLYEMPLNMESWAISKSGDFYLLDMYSSKPGKPENLAFEDWEGIYIRKFTLKK